MTHARATTRAPRPAAQPAPGVAGIAALLASLLLAACAPGPGSGSTAVGSPGTAASPSGAAGPRPSSPAVVRIVQPAANATVTGTSLRVVLTLEHARIVSQTSTNIRPDEGHVHLYVNGVLVSMNYGLTQEIAVHPGTWVLKAEFVAADHAPFSPRVWSDAVVFTVR